jgi:hypothetical protein
MSVGAITPAISANHFISRWAPRGLDLGHWEHISSYQIGDWVRNKIDIGCDLLGSRSGLLLAI